MVIGQGMYIFIWVHCCVSNLVVITMGVSSPKYIIRLVLTESQNHHIKVDSFSVTAKFDCHHEALLLFPVKLQGHQMILPSKLQSWTSAESYDKTSPCVVNTGMVVWGASKQIRINYWNTICLQLQRTWKVSIIDKWCVGVPFRFVKYTVHPLNYAYCSHFYLHALRLLHNPPFNEVERYLFHLVPLSVCGQNSVHSVFSTILAGSISYLHILSSNFRRCVAMVVSQFKKFEILANSLNL